MSFASEVKDEVSRIDLPPKVKTARLAALVQLLASVELSSSGLKLSIKTGNANVARAVTRDLRTLYGISGQMVAVRSPRFYKANTYMLVVDEKTREILQDLDLWTDSGLQAHPHQKFIDSDERVRAYLQGCFMACGSLNAPKTANYHLEMTVSSDSLAEFIVRQMSRFHISGKITKRRHMPVVYLKASEQISDFLRCIGANQAVLAFEDVRIERDFYNNFSRLDNCEVANEVKSMQAARKQVEAVQLLKDRGILDALEEKQREIGYLRLQNPEANLLELSQAYQQKTGIKLSKSGIRHRLLKLTEAAAKYQK